MQQLTVKTENKVIDILLLIDVSYGHRPCEKNDNTSKVYLQKSGSEFLPHTPSHPKISHKSKPQDK